MTTIEKPTKSKVDNVESNDNFSVLFRALAGILSLGVLFTSLFSRYKMLELPLSRDEGAYGYLGKMAIQGKIPYVDFHEMKPPLLYYFYGLGGALFGFNDTGMRIFALVLTLLSSIFIFFIIKEFSDTVSGLVGAAFYSFVSMNMFCFGFSMVAEHIINVLILGAICLMVRTKKKILLNNFFLGIIFAIDVLVKQSAFLFFPLFLFGIWQNTKEQWMKPMISFLSGGFLVLILTILFLQFNGALDAAKYWLIEYPSQYGESVSWEKGKIYFQFFFTQFFSFSFVHNAFLTLCLFGSFIAIKKRENLFFIFYFLLAFASVFPGLRFYGQYWLLILPPLAICASLLIGTLNHYVKNVGYLICIFVLFALLHQFNDKKSYYFSSTPSRKMDRLLDGNPFEQIKNMSKYANSIMSKEDNILMLGSEPQVYLYTNKNAPIDYVYTGFFAKNIQKNIEFRVDMMRQIESSKPNYILFNIFPYSWLLIPGANTDIYEKSFRYATENYQAIASYDLSKKAYFYSSKGDAIDAYKANQIILFKRR
jgi:hypothetical protein